MPNANTLAALRKGLGEMGFVEGRNVAFELRGTDQYDQFQVMAGELVRRQVAVIFVWGTANSALAAKAATSTIPIVFANGSDPVKSGIVESLNRPGGNVTGVTFYNSGLVAKRLELLREIVPQANVIGFLTNPRIQTSAENLADMQAAIGVLGGKLLVLNASTERDRYGFRKRCRGTRRCTSGRLRSDIHHETGANRRTSGALSDSRKLFYQGLFRCRRSVELRYRFRGIRTSSRHLHRPYSQRREACRSSGPAADQI